MNLREANDILQNPKEHWSHEIDDAKKYCVEAVKYLVNAADYRFMDEAQIAINYIDERIAVTRQDEEPITGTIEVIPPICADCTHFDLVGYCTCDHISDRVSDRFRSPIDDASSCKFYSPYRKEKRDEHN